MRKCVTIFSNLLVTQNYSVDVVASSKDAEVLQRDFNTMNGWSVEWLMLFNAKKMQVCAL